MKKTIRDFDLNDKKVIIRCDFNVPMKDGNITDDNKIIESLPTIQYAIDHGAKIILMSHLGRIKTEEDKADNSLGAVAVRLNELLNQEVVFVPTTSGSDLEQAVASLSKGEVLLIENTRFEDLDEKCESNNDPSLGEYWASLGDIFINDAFGVSHRSHASVVGIASHLPNGVGFLIEKELKIVKGTIDNPKHPFTVILGGAKIHDKIPVLKNIVEVADHILIGGGMSHTFLQAQGYSIGTSLLDVESLEFCKTILSKYKDKIILPVDVKVSKEFNKDAPYRTVPIDEIDSDEMGMDIGEGTVAVFREILEKSKTIIWNGPVGVFEFEPFAIGTKALAECLTMLDATTIIGGGDTGAAIIGFGYQDNMTHISTGGGASLELLEGKELPGIAVIDDQLAI